ncbi:MULTISPECIES: hypothetical protein [Bacillati]|jgi:hypothetical protein|uniref:Uncharacterized protein n=1 Tax=Brevibacillus borstelensis AK1 TaxID=1300222 RepID=M8DZ99_9BACL|nr:MULTISPECIES: hypothetical protein [Terrabacteria group]EMT52376.1 hypothetical protein I532_12004 [Brevibacillus borstelensis AK1]KKX54815.1 membrane protein [Brevibacillus borstelensis cifa_chp40]MBE5396162.1 hypothetical protein [Brevibacillus borstelensis]MCC0563067.1 hypothetical protein [Brevibacillus borstelensis]MED1742811.1 hypothetical protein [Brevibacillus borstelensis]
MTFVLVNGLIAGLILAAFLALCDGLFGTSTFAVLIDVSYVPGMAGLPSVIELLIHLLISVVVVFFMAYFYPRDRRATVRFLLYWALAFTVAYLPFSLLSGTPMSFVAFLIWIVGHVLYTIVVAAQIERQR